jgi:hypothetical protein
VEQTLDALRESGATRVEGEGAAIGLERCVEIFEVLFVVAAELLEELRAALGIRVGEGRLPLDHQGELGALAPLPQTAGEHVQDLRVGGVALLRGADQGESAVPVASRPRSPGPGEQRRRCHGLGAERERTLEASDLFIRVADFACHGGELEQRGLVHRGQLEHAPVPAGRDLEPPEASVLEACGLERHGQESVGAVRELEAPILELREERPLLAPRGEGGEPLECVPRGRIVRQCAAEALERGFLVADPLLEPRQGDPDRGACWATHSLEQLCVGEDRLLGATESGERGGSPERGGVVIWRTGERPFELLESLARVVHRVRP